MRKSLIGLGLLLLVVAAAGWWSRQASSGPGSDSSAPANGGKPVQTVTLFSVQQRDMPVSLEAAGTVLPLNTVELRPQLTSTVRSIAIKEGQFVRQGELLFSFDDRPDQANLDKARAQLRRDQVTLADLERQWKRAQELRAQNFIAQSAADTVQAQLEAQRAAVVADEAAVRSGEVGLSYANLRAPMSGRTGQITVNPGSLVSPGGAALVAISQMDPIGVSFNLPEAQLGALLVNGPPGAPGAKKTPIALSVMLPAAGPQRGASAPARETLEGTVNFIDNAVDTATGTIRVKGELRNPKQQLWPGQYVTVRLTLRTLKDAAVVPQAALILRGPERLVYVVDADMQVALRPVQPRFSNGEFVAVEGVVPGEKVVVEGKQNLRPGVTVREAGPGKPGAAASGAASAQTGASR